MTKGIAKKEEDLAKIIHDLKTPLNAQIGALESFLETTKSKISQEEKDLLELTLNSCNYMQNLIETLNLVNSLDYNPLSLNYKKFDIVKLIKNCIKEMNILLKYQELKVIFNTEEETIVQADQLQIKRVIDNLLTNSLNYAYKNTEIKISISIDNNDLTFEIENHSPYISPRAIKEIFGKYKTQNSLYCRGGVGLGLYVSNEIIKAHDGKMHAKSSLDEINTFGFTIPRY